jgi:hypothetical protein
LGGIVNRLTVALGIVVATSIGPVMAQDATVTTLSLELNGAAEVTTGGCRLTYVATNGSDVPMGQMSYEVAVFNTEGIVSRILVLEFGALTVGKTKVVQFDLPDQSCGDIAKIVVNDVAACTLEDGSAGDFCLSGLTTTSRAPIQFGL